METIVKKCTTCKIEKPNTIEFFSKHKSTDDGLNYRCKSCVRQYNREYREKNRESEIARMRIYYDNNLPKIKEYNNKRKKRTNEWKRERRKDPLIKLYDSVVRQIAFGIKQAKTKRTKKTEKILGCSFEEFKSYIENKFLNGMSWENHGKNGWHLDHIIPKSYAKTDEEVYKLNHYTNFQPLWAVDNWKKGNRYIG